MSNNQQSVPHQLALNYRRTIVSRLTTQNSPRQNPSPQPLFPSPNSTLLSTSLGPHSNLSQYSNQNHSKTSINSHPFVTSTTFRIANTESIFLQHKYQTSSPFHFPLSALVIFLISLATCQAQQTPPLWKPSLPVPTSAQLLLLENVQFHVIKSRTPEQDGYNWLHGVALIWHKNQLYSSFGHNAGKENTASEVANGRISTDGGKTWGPVFQIDNGEQDNLAVSHGAFLSHQNKLWAFMGAFYNKMENTHTRAYRLDEKTNQWQKLGVVIEDGFWPMQEPLPMTDGNYIMAGIVAKNPDIPGNPAAVAISHGTDFTKWNLVVIPRPADLRMWGESTVIVDGPNIINIARYHDHGLALVSHSKDYGRTWTPVAESNLPMTTSKPYAGTLSTGQNYLICTTTADTGKARAPLTIAVTDPGEKQFSRIYKIRDAVHPGPGESHPAARLSYPYAVQHNNKLYVGYSNSADRGSNRNSAELAIIPIDSLQKE